MENIITNDMNVVYYAVKINGVITSAKYSEKMMAEMAKEQLPEDQKALAEVVQVTADGKQLLLG